MQETFAHPEYLVETAWLSEHLDDPALRIFDCTAHLLPDPEKRYRVEAARAEYNAGHIPGAGFLDFVDELSDPAASLPLMLPGAARFCAAAAAHGIGDGVRVVLYSTENIWWATRVWWMLRAFGFDNAAVLNGGLQKWQAEKRPVSTAPAKYPRGNFRAKPRPQLFLGKEAVLAALGDKATRIVSARSPEQHRGEEKVPYGRPGRIPGSVNVPANALLDAETNTYLDAKRLHGLFEASGALAAEKVITYCGLGIAATNDAFVLALLGFDPERIGVYDASMSEWSRDESLPMETG
ncbi:MAG: sulfurtransferase [Alphaproteobacteria bacterium]|nr:sulfurtransferase [Alphaproteobacteria bacterium]